MKFTDFEHLACNPNLPLKEQLSPELRVLALSRRGLWEQAHEIAQDLPEPHGAWLHAYLHREEGDLGNASYWYFRADQPVPPANLSLEEEWKLIAAYFCEN